MRDKDILQNRMIRLVLPIAFQQFMLALVGASDAVMLGRLSQNCMSAVSLASQVTFVFNLFMTAFVIGENMFVAQYFGKKDRAGICRIVRLVLCVSCFTAVLFMFGTIVFPVSIMHFLTNEPELIVMGSRYLQKVGVSYLLSAVAQVYLAYMKNCGAVKMSTLLSSLAVILNIALNGVFIFGMCGAPAMGIEGAAAATVIATAVQMAGSVFYVNVKVKQLHFRMQVRDREITRRFWDKVVPVLLNELVWGCGFTVYSVIMGHMGTDAAAANSIANISKNLVVCLCLGFGNAGGIIVGNELGAEHLEEAKEAGRRLTKAAIVCGVLSGALLIILSPVIVKMVHMTPDAKEYLKGMLIICSYYLLGKSVNSMTIGGIFPAGGDSRFGLLCDTVTLWFITIPLGCLCAFVLRFPVIAVYFVLNLDEIVKLPIVYRHYRKYGWVRNIT